MARIKKAQTGNKLKPNYSNLKGKGWNYFKTPTSKDSSDYRKGFSKKVKGKDLEQYPYPSGAEIRGYNEASKRIKKQRDGGKTPAWQRKEGKDPSGGLNAKGVASYRRANPGSKLKTAVTTKPSKLKPGSKAANRRKSFCARMSGMKRSRTSAKTANDPNSRINKSLRKWNC